MSKQNKEEFCPLCVTIPLALAGAGATSVGSLDNEKNKKLKRILKWFGVSLTIFSILLMIYWYKIKECKECKK